jgi:hypothetical protein
LYTLEDQTRRPTVIDRAKFLQLAFQEMKKRRTVVP